MTVENQIRNLLVEYLEPLEIKLVNDSHKHIGHGNVPDPQNSHFSLTIVSKAFNNKTRLQQHQMVYGCLRDLMDHPIHALIIHSYTPEEYKKQVQKG